MTPAEAATVMKGVAELIGVVVWPGVIFFLLIRHGAPLKAFLENMSELSIKGGGVEATAKRRVEAAAALGGAVAGQKRIDPGTDVSEEARRVAKVVADNVTPSTIRKTQSARALWVDDNPENNVLERRSLESLGIRFDLSTSTEDALRRLRQGGYDVVISDMGRPPDVRAGYTLLDAMRNEGITAPFIIYSSGQKPEHVEEAKRHTALGTTDRPNDLFELVLSALA